MSRAIWKKYRIFFIVIVAGALAYAWWNDVQTAKAHVACTDSLFVRMNLYDGIWNTYLDDQIAVRDAAKKDEKNPTIATWDDMGQSLFNLTSNLARNGEKLDNLQPLVCLTNIGERTLRSWEGWENVTSGDLVKISRDMNDAHEALVTLIETSVECYTSILAGMETLDTGMGLAISTACKASETAADAIPPISEKIAQFTRLMAR
ncbi:MAG TPA: hypothetical protein QGI62_09125 [Anaerolineales bacterium]|jgi:hypothetical protein|nr:hypothetical protein [Anaerolineales bacterium]